jgi:hypothetical protein
MAPDASQGTTFREDSRSDAWAVVNGVTFDVKYNHTAAKIAIFSLILAFIFHFSRFH